MLNHYAVPRHGAGGTRHATLARCLTQAGHSVTIFPASVRRGSSATVAIPSGTLYLDEEDEGVIFRHVRTRQYRNAPGRLLNMLDYRRNILRAVADLPTPDVVMGSCVHLHAADAGRVLARRYAVPFAFEIRDVWPEALLHEGGLTRWHPVYLYLRMIELRLLRCAELVVALQPGMVPYAEAHGVRPGRAVYVPNGVDPSFFPELGPPPEDRPFTASFFGAHGAANGLDSIVRAAAILQGREDGRDVRFLLVGDGPSKPALQALAAELGVRNIAFSPAAPKPQLLPLAEQTHVFLFNLLPMAAQEKYGVSANKLFDYMLFARPVVFACRSLNNPIEEAGAGVSVEPNDAEAIAAAVLRLRALSAQERQQMGSRGRTWVVENHDMRKVACKLERVITELVAQRKG